MNRSDRHLLHGVRHHAPRLGEQRNPRVDEGLLGQPEVLAAGVVVDAVEEREAKQRAKPAQESIHQAAGADRPAARGKETETQVTGKLALNLAGRKDGAPSLPRKATNNFGDSW